MRCYRSLQFYLKNSEMLQKLTIISQILWDVTVAYNYISKTWDVTEPTSMSHRLRDKILAYKLYLRKSEVRISHIFFLKGWDTDVQIVYQGM
jgi:hypothetical protein